MGGAWMLSEYMEASATLSDAPVVDFEEAWNYVVVWKYAQIWRCVNCGGFL